jgi:hypothetical protein
MYKESKIIECDGKRRLDIPVYEVENIFDKRNTSHRK